MKARLNCSDCLVLSFLHSLDACSTLSLHLVAWISNSIICCNELLIHQGKQYKELYSWIVIFNSSCSASVTMRKFKWRYCILFILEMHWGLSMFVPITCTKGRLVTPSYSILLTRFDCIFQESDYTSPSRIWVQFCKIPEIWFFLLYIGVAFHIESRVNDSRLVIDLISILNSSWFGRNMVGFNLDFRKQ